MCIPNLGWRVKPGGFLVCAFSGLKEHVIKVLNSIHDHIVVKLKAVFGRFPSLPNVPIAEMS